MGDDDKTADWDYIADREAESAGPEVAEQLDAERAKKELAAVRECVECGQLQYEKTCWRCKAKTREWFSNRSYTTERKGRFR